LLYGDANFLTDYLADGPKGEPRPNRVSFAQGLNPQPSPEFKGQVICVNGKIWPFLEVESRPYRFRIVNGSNSRVYVLRLSNALPDKPSEPDVANQNAAIDLIQIGSDGGLFPQSVALKGSGISTTASDGTLQLKANSQDFLVLAPGERADVIIDFSGKSGNFYLTNHAEGTAPLGNGGDETIDITDPAKPIPKLTNGILEFRVTLPLVQNANSPLTMDFEALASLDSDLGNFASQPHFPLPSTPTRQYVMEEFGPLCLTIEEAIKENPRGWKAITFQPDIDRPTNAGFLWAGAPPDNGDIGANPNGGPQPHPDAGPPHQLGNNVELWEFYNLSPDVHPIHLHHSPVQVHSRVPLANPIRQTPESLVGFGVDPNEKGWKDTVRVNPGELTRILVRFDDGGDKTRSAEYYTGHYVWHCHILEHEDMGMMRPLEIELGHSPQTADCG
jgi:spore coat protein A, manganese oxidase